MSNSAFTGGVSVVAESQNRSHYAQNGFTFCGVDIRYKGKWRVIDRGNMVSCRRCRMIMERY